MLNKIQLSISLLLFCAGICMLILLTSLFIPRQDNTITPNDEGWFCGTISLDLNSRVIDSIHLTGQKIWKANCVSCHSFNKKVIGPAITGVAERRDSLWIVQSILSYEVLLKAKDSTALQLFSEYRKIRHPNFEQIPDQDFESLIKFLIAESSFGFY